MGTADGVASGILRQSAVDMARAVRAGRLSARELVSASLARIAALDGRLKAFITVCGEQALAEAARADSMAAGGEPLPALHGLPIAIKDLTATEGIRTTFGSLLHKDNVPDADELVVARLRRAGAIVVGKTNTPEFGFGARCANALSGPTANPYDPSRTSGGSSGGSAVAVAAGMVALAHGTDFGGSVRTPASFCDVVGLRPTPGMIPAVPKAVLWDTLSVHGILARTVEDAALMLEAVAGPDVRDPVAAGTTPWRAAAVEAHAADKPRLAASVGLGVARIDPEVRRVFEKAVDAMVPVVAERAEAAPDCRGAQEAFETLRAARLYRSFGKVVEDHRDKVSETFRWNVERGRAIPISDYLEAEAERGRIYGEFQRFFERWDILATAAASVLPFANAEADVVEIDGEPTRNIIEYLTVTYVISLVGFPSLCIPCGRSRSGLPVGLQLVARPFEEARLLAFARRLQNELDFRHRWPALP